MPNRSVARSRSIVRASSKWGIGLRIAQGIVADGIAMFILNAVCAWPYVHLGFGTGCNTDFKAVRLPWLDCYRVCRCKQQDGIAGTASVLPRRTVAGLHVSSAVRPCHPGARLSAQRTGDMREGCIALQASPKPVCTHCPAAALRGHGTNLLCIGAFRGMMPPEEWEKAVHQIKIRMQCGNQGTLHSGSS